MSIGVGAGDFIAIPTFCWKVYKKCKDSTSDFRNISNEVGSLHNVLLETREMLSEQTLSPQQQTRFSVAVAGCTGLLDEVQKLLDRYESLGTQSRRTIDRMGWSLHNTTDLRLRIIAQANFLEAFNNR